MLNSEFYQVANLLTENTTLASMIKFALKYKFFRQEILPHFTWSANDSNFCYYFDFTLLTYTTNKFL